MPSPGVNRKGSGPYKGYPFILRTNNTSYNRIQLGGDLRDRFRSCEESAIDRSIDVPLRRNVGDVLGSGPLRRQVEREAR